MKAKKKLEKGFSLLETLLVIGIIGVMTGIAIMGSAGPVQTYTLTFAPEGLLTTVPLPPRTSIMLETGIPDTPMAFGNTAPVYIGGVSGGPPSGMFFTPTGSFSDGTFYNPINGTIFVGMPNQPN